MTQIDPDPSDPPRKPFFAIDPTPSPANTSSKYDWIFTFVFGGLFVLAGAAIVGLQVFGYLYDGFWVPFSLIDFVQLFSASAWLSAPHQWVGAHKILSTIPASVALIGFGVLIWNADNL